MRTTINYHLNKGLANNLKQKQIVDGHHSLRKKVHSKTAKTLRDTIDLHNFPIFSQSPSNENNLSKGSSFTYKPTSETPSNRKTQLSFFHRDGVSRERKLRVAGSTDLLLATHTRATTESVEPLKIKFNLESNNVPFETVKTIDNYDIDSQNIRRSALQSRQRDPMYKTLGSDGTTWNRYSKFSSTTLLKPISLSAVLEKPNAREKKIKNILTKVRQNTDKSESTFLEGGLDDKLSDYIKENTSPLAPSKLVSAHHLSSGHASGLVSPISRKDTRIVGFQIPNDNTDDGENLSLEEMTAKLKIYREKISAKLKVISAGGVDSKLKISKRFKKKRDKAEVKARFVHSLLTATKKMEDLGLTPEELMFYNVFPSGPFERKDSRAFIRYAKNGSFEKVRELLFECKYHVYDYDNMKSTALHWASKRGYSKVMQLLLDYGADPNAKDISGRTPLFLAATSGKIVPVKLLISHGSNPMIRSEGHKVAADYAEDPFVRNQIIKGYKIHVILSVCSKRKQKEVWKNMKIDFNVRFDELE